MNRLLSLSLLALVLLPRLLQQPPSPVHVDGTGDGTGAGPLRDGEEVLAEALELARRNASGALDLVDAHLARDAGEAEDLRARLHFVQGVLGAELDEPRPTQEVVGAFGSARALAGPGQLRRDATYDAATVLLREGERRRAAIPELGGGAAGGLPPGLGLPGGAAGGNPAGPGAQPGAPGAEQEDPLELARAAYLAARERFLERLRLDWRDPDTRANLELCLRRLRELDEVERQREEQKQDQEQQQGDSSEDSKGDSSDEKQPSDSGEDQPQEGEDEQQEPQEGEQPQDEGQEDQAEPQEKEAGSKEPAERILTREEAMRLLDRLEEIEEEARDLEQRLRAVRRVPVERDW